jgi:hypothetical protein
MTSTSLPLTFDEGNHVENCYRADRPVGTLKVTKLGVQRL